MKKILIALLLLFIPTIALGARTNFSDVWRNSWYEDAVEYVTERHWMRGYSNNEFGPDDEVTRAHLAAALMRYDEDTVEILRNLQAIICLNRTNFLNFANVEDNEEDEYEDALIALCNDHDGFHDDCTKEYDLDTGELEDIDCD